MTQQSLVASILNEPSLLSDDLRIIATAAKLDATSRELLVSAADELEDTHKQMLLERYARIEAQQRCMALQERLMAAINVSWQSLAPNKQVGVWNNVEVIVHLWTAVK